jgi:hypothetical protein
VTADVTTQTHSLQGTKQASTCHACLQSILALAKDHVHSWQQFYYLPVTCTESQSTALGEHSWATHLSLLVPSHPPTPLRSSCLELHACCITWASFATPGQQPQAVLCYVTL